MILISAAGSGGTNRLVESVDYKDFIGVTNDKYKIFASVLNKNYLTPSANDEKRYIEAVNKIIENNNVELFIPNSDLEVYVVTKNIDKINTDTFLPDFSLVDIFFDKLKMHNIYEKLGIPSAKTIHVTSFDDVKRAFEEIKSSPLWCRIRFGSGSKHTSKVIDADDAISYIKHACNVYGLKLTDFIINEYLPGDDIAVVTVWKNDEIKMCKMAKRTKYYGAPGESPPTIIESFYDKEIESVVLESLSKFKGKNGVLNVDMKLDRDSKPKITEINAGRFYYNMTLFNYGKLNIFQSFLDLTKGIEPKYFSDDPEVVFVREQDNEPVVVEKKKIENIKPVI